MSDLKKIVDEKFTSINNEIRTLNNVTGKLGLDAMAEQLSNTNNEVDTQAALIAQISSLLKTKAISGGAISGGGGSVETCDITVINNTDYPLLIFATFLSDGDICSMPTFVDSGPFTINNVVRYSTIVTIINDNNGANLQYGDMLEQWIPDSVHVCDQCAFAVWIVYGDYNELIINPL